MNERRRAQLDPMGDVLVFLVCTCDGYADRTHKKTVGSIWKMNYVVAMVSAAENDEKVDVLYTRTQFVAHTFEKQNRNFHFISVIVGHKTQLGCATIDLVCNVCIRAAKRRYRELGEGRCTDTRHVNGCEVIDMLHFTRRRPSMKIINK